MYKITIEKTSEEVKIQGKEWKRLKEKPDGTGEMGYTPEIEKTVEVTAEVYKQIVDDLDLVAVINAINKK